MRNKQVYHVVIIVILLLSFSSFNSLATNLSLEKENNQIFNKTIESNDSDSPSHFTWKDVNGSDFTTPIRDLRPIPACEAFALCVVLETMVQYKLGFNFGCDLSEAHLFFCSGGDYKWGVYIEDAADYLVEHGVPDEACWPYPQEKKQYSCNTTCPDWKNRTVKITNWRYLNDSRTEIKKALINHGPVAAYIDLFKDFMVYSGGIYKHRWGKPVGSHWISIIGYNDNPGYWICENSYGTDWGEKGYFRIKYGEIGIEKHVLCIEDIYGNFPVVYVDDDNNCGPWNGTIEHPFQSIEEGIDHAYDGWAVVVRNGTYIEKLEIDKSINLIGENRGSSIIQGDGTGNVISVTNGNVSISGFTIGDGGKNLYDAGIEVKLYRTGGSATIKDNIIRYNNLGIYIHYPSSNIIKDNIIENNSKGVYILESYSTFIENNTIRNNKINGIELFYAHSFIFSNDIYNNKQAGIFLDWKSDGVFICNKNIIENNSIGILINESKGCVIFRNNLVNNNQQAYIINSPVNLWMRNYWSDWPHVFPKKIKGVIGDKITIPWMNFDWFPQKNPYV